MDTKLELLIKKNTLKSVEIWAIQQIHQIDKQLDLMDRIEDEKLSKQS